jgi:hypothetical protein
MYIDPTRLTKSSPLPRIMLHVTYTTITTAGAYIPVRYEVKTAWVGLPSLTHPWSYV